MQAVAQPHTLTVSIPSAPSSWTTKMFHKLGETLAVSNPELAVKVHDSAQLFKQGEELKKMSEGQLDMATFSINDVTDLIPEFQMLTRGYLFANFSHLSTVYEGEIGKEVMGAISERLHVQVLSIIYIGTRVLGLKDKKPVKEPEDLKDVPLRMPEKVSWQKLGRALGAAPVPVPINEIQKAYDEGRIAGQDNPLPALVSNRELNIHQIVSTNHMIDFLFVGISKAKWAALTETQRANLESAAKTAKIFNDKGRKEEEERLLSWAASLKILVLPNIPAFKAHMDAFYEKEGTKYPKDEKWKAIIERS